MSKLVLSAFEDMGSTVRFTGPNNVMDISKMDPRCSEFMVMIAKFGSVEFGDCEDCPEYPPLITEDDIEVIEHTITQEDLDANPGLVDEVKVGDVVELGMATPEELEAMETELDTLRENQVKLAVTEEEVVAKPKKKK